MVGIKVQGLSFDFGRRPVLKDINLQVYPGELLGIIGPNGAGKSTLLRLISGYLSPKSGRVLVAGEDVRSLSRQAVARLIAVVPQQNELEFDFTVEEVVQMGRFPYVHRWRGETRADREAAVRALEATGTDVLRDRLVSELSGGELQRVIIARALAQVSRVLLLDEPTSALDINHQVEILELVAEITYERQLATVAAMHDLNLAAMFCDRVAILAEGQIVAVGKPEDVLNSELLEEAYGIEVMVERSSDGNLRVYPMRKKCKERVRKDE